MLVLYRGGKRVARGDLSTSMGRTLIEEFFAAFMKEELRGAAKLVEAREGGFTDAPAPWLSLINLASVRDLGERIVGGEIDPLRFRANLYLEGLAPWRELDLVDREIAIGPVQAQGREGHYALCRGQRESLDRRARSQHPARARRRNRPREYGRLCRGAQRGRDRARRILRHCRGVSRREDQNGCGSVPSFEPLIGAPWPGPGRISGCSASGPS